MADTAVTERRIRPIQDLIANDQWKQAQKECDKWQKKGESSDRFLALKATVLLHQPDAKSQQRGSAELLQLCRRTPPILNIEAIQTLERSLQQLSLGDIEGPKLWERAVAAKPTDKDLVETWLNASISVSNWQNAQKATMALRKAFPKNRQYEYWNILLCYLIHEDQALPEKDRKLFGTLANRMIVKAAQPGQPEKMISNTEELNLLVAVLTKTGGVSELLQLLQSEHLGQVIQSDPFHADTLLLQVIHAGKDLPEVRNAIERLMASHDNVDEISQDDRVWSLYVDDSITNEVLKPITDRFEPILTQNPSHRQANLGKIDRLVNTARKSDDASKDVLDACRKYYDLYGSKSFCFDDLIHRLRRAGVGVVKKFLSVLKEDTTSLSAPFQKLFILKLEYNLLTESTKSVGEMLELASNVLQLCSSCQDDHFVAPEAVLLAAYMLLHVAIVQEQRNESDGNNDSDNTHNPGSTHSEFFQQLIFQASMILKSASYKFKDYYPLRVLLLQIQMISGQASLAMDTFFNLNIKNLQWETVGYLLMTRISSIHPRQTGRGDETLSPDGALDAALTVGKNCQRSLDRAIREGLKNGAYSNVLDTVQLRTNLQRSVVKRVFTLEHRRIRHAVGIPVLAGFHLETGEVVDLRDASFMPKYGVQDDSLPSLLRCGPRPGQAWINAMTLHDLLVTCACTSILESESRVMQDASARLQDTSEKLNGPNDDLTLDEQHAVQTELELTGILLSYMATGTVDTDRIKKVTDLEKSIPAVEACCINDVEYPDWRYLHHSHTRLASLQVLAGFSSSMVTKLQKDQNKASQTSAEVSTRAKILKETLSVINVQVESICTRAKKLKAGLNEAGVLGRLVDAVLGRSSSLAESELEGVSEAIAAMQDEASVEEYCGSMRNSWDDSLDGILAFKIRKLPDHS